jgi:hypothetical protein
VFLALSNGGEATPWAATLPSNNPRAYPIVVNNPDNRDYSSCTLMYTVNYLVPGGGSQSTTINIPPFFLPKNTDRKIVGYFDSLALPNSTMANGPLVFCN